MKSLKITFLSLILCMSTIVGYSQIDVTINPIGALFGNISLDADFLIKENLSTEVSVGFGSGDLFGTDWRNLSFAGTGKYYFSPNRGADKFYADVFLKYINRKWDYSGDDLDYNSTRLGLGFGVGYKIVSGGGFVFDINFGAGRALVDSNNAADGQLAIEWTNVMLTGKFGVGYRFGGNK